MNDVNIQGLIKALLQVRQHTLQAFESYFCAGKLTLPLQNNLNPPIWELGHVAWFQEYWIARNKERSQGVACKASSNWPLSCLVNADLWFDSAKVAHSSRWSLPLFSAQECIQYAEKTLNQTLELLENESNDSPALYFYWLVLQHEAMHLEASAYMAQSLGFPFQALWQQSNTKSPSVSMQATAHVQSQNWTLGSEAEIPFCFDNELGQQTLVLSEFAIDLQPVNWTDYLNFVSATGHPLPRYIRQNDNVYETEVFSCWAPLNLTAPAVHLSWHDAQAYCAWAQCRLPTEAEWDCAAKTLNHFEWGQVWEWTQDTFTAYEGFVIHPYAEYSAPWFGTHKVLRGAAQLTHPCLQRINYRNFYTPDRDDIYAGFRTCAL